MTPVSGKGSSGRCLLLLSYACSTLRKIHCIRLLKITSNFDFKLTTKAWFNNHTLDNAIIIPNHKSFRKSREALRGCCCPVYVGESLPAALCQDTMVNTVQDVVGVRADVGDESLHARRVYHPSVYAKTIFDGNK